MTLLEEAHNLYIDDIDGYSYKKFCEIVESNYPHWFEQLPNELSDYESVLSKIEEKFGKPLEFHNGIENNSNWTWKDYTQNGSIVLHVRFKKEEDAIVARLVV